MNDVRRAMKPPQEQPRDSSTVIDNGVGFMVEHNLDSSTIDPTTVALAIHKPGQVNRAGAQTHLDTLDLIRAQDYSTVIPGEDHPKAPSESSKDLLLQRTYELSRRARIKRYFAGAVITLGLGGVIGGVVAQADAAIQERNTGKPTTALDVVTYDESILPGDMGADVPFVSTLRRLVPGVPDRTPYIWTREVDQERTVTRQEERIESSYDTAQTINPASPDLSLTGEEYQLAREKAEELVANIDHPEQLRITSFGADGRVSDEFNGQVGEANPEQLQLAFDRGAIASLALADVLRENGFILPGEPVVTGHEIVLTPDQVQSLRGTALEQKLARDRGAELFIEGRRRVVEMVPRTRIERAERTDALGQMPLDAVMGFVGLAGAGATAALSNTRLERPANRAARRELKRALKKAA